MVKHVYGIYDLVSGDVVGPLWLFPSDGPATRMLQDVVNAPDSQVHAHPGDFALVRLGTVDLETLDVIAVSRDSAPVVAPAPGLQPHRCVVCVASSLVARPVPLVAD